AIPVTSTPLDFSQRPDLSKLEGRSVLITGSARGIGLACATELAEAGAIVTISDVRSEDGEAATRELTSKGLRVQFVRSDVTSYSSQVELFKKAIAFGGGKLDIMVPNAGICAEQNLFDMVPSDASNLDEPPEPGYSTMDVNLKGVYYSCYLALHYFRLPRSTSFAPTIILIASLAGYVGFPSSATYSMSKFGIRGLFYGTRDRAAAAAKPPVRINFVVQAVTRFGADASAHGRAAGVFPQGTLDLGDDLDGGFAGQRTQQGVMDILAAMDAPPEKKGAEMVGEEKVGEELERQDSATAAEMGVFMGLAE
ncbi:NAD(P)-binding protein, partial [Lizonia empirigonia]